MSHVQIQQRWKPAPVVIIAALLVISGFLLTSVSWWFLLLAAAGTFGPGICRELGWLRDRDEFQRQAAWRAGYHAFLATGVVAFVLLAWYRAGGTMERPLDLTSFFLALLWCTWFFSSLLAYWGAGKTARRVLTAFGCVWLAFTILSNIGSEWTGWTALLLHPLLAVPFLGLAWLAGVQPRLAGLLLVAAAAFFCWFFGWAQQGLEGIASDVFVLFIGPLLACGVALLCAEDVRAGGDISDEDDRGSSAAA